METASGATTRSLTSGQWEEEPDYKQQTPEAVEGAGTFKLIGQNKYILMYDVYMKGKYQFTETTDLKNFKVIDSEVKMNFHPRHGTYHPHYPCRVEAHHRQMAFKGNGQYDDSQQSGAARFPC